MLRKLIIPALIVLASVVGAETFPVPALPFAPLSYTCYKASGEITIDGSMAKRALDQPLHRYRRQ